MYIETDYQSLVEEVKERNRLFMAINHVREIALNACKENTPEESKSQFRLILQKCDDVLKQAK
jgi:hypothetical protein